MPLATVRRNWHKVVAMKKLGVLAATAIFLLSFPFFAQGATKSIAQIPMTLVTKLSASNQSVGMVVKGKMIYLIGNVTGVASTDGFVQALDVTGTVQWSLPLDNGSNEIATAATIDSAGNIWVIGSAQTPTATPTPSASPSTTQSASPTPSASATPSATALNPDAITIDPVTPMRKDLTSLILWKISPAGSLVATYSTEIGVPFLVRNAIFANHLINVVGIISTTSGHAGFLIQSDLSGTFGKPIQVGNSDTELHAIARKSDGSLVLMGSSSETIAKQPRKGLRDGIIVAVRQPGIISSVVRSFNTSSARTWQSSTSSLFLGGDALAGKKGEAVVTKFGSTLLPVWTIRFASSGPALVADGLASHFMLFSSIGPIAGINGWKPRSSAALTLVFDAKGALKGVYGAPAITTPMAVGYSTELGIVVLGRGPAGVSIFHVLPR